MDSQKSPIPNKLTPAQCAARPTQPFRRYPMFAQLVGHLLLDLDALFSWWSPMPRFVELDDLPGGYDISYAYDISTDGRVICGYGTNLQGIERA